jgi:hypothetical protein
MSKKTLMKTARSALRLAAGILAVLTLGASTAWAAAGGGGGPLTCSISPENGTATVNEPFTFTANTTGGKGSKTYAWTFDGPASPTSATTQAVNVTYSSEGGPFGVAVLVTDGQGTQCNATTNVSVGGGGGGGVTSRGDTYATPVATTLNVAASRVSGVLYNDFGGTGAAHGATGQQPANGGSLQLQADGSFTYTPSASLSDNSNDSFLSGERRHNLSAVTTVNINILSKQMDLRS